MTGTRDMARAGHQAAAAAATTARARHSPIRPQGRASRSIRCPAAASTAGAATIHPRMPSAPPTTAAATPTITPLASMTSRRWRSVAPSAASSPSWRWRRWATTTKPAAAIRATRAMARVTTISTKATTACFSLPKTSSRNAGELAGPPA